MINLSTSIASVSPGQLAWFVKFAIEGFVSGCLPAWKQWALPPLYQSGIRFAFEKDHGSGNERFCLPLETYANRVGDCDDLVIYRLCELNSSVPYRKVNYGRVMVGWDPPPPLVYTCAAEWVGSRLHVAVRLPNGVIEDPSISLGAPHK